MEGDSSSRAELDMQRLSQLTSETMEHVSAILRGHTTRNESFELWRGVLLRLEQLLVPLDQASQLLL